MSIVKFDGRPSWSLDASEIIGLLEGTASVLMFRPSTWTLPIACFSIDPTEREPGTGYATQKHFALFPVSLASRDQDGGSTIDIYELSEK